MYSYTLLMCSNKMVITLSAVFSQLWQKRMFSLDGRLAVFFNRQQCLLTYYVPWSGEDDTCQVTFKS